MIEKTILFYINTISRGGAQRVIVQLARHFAEAGYRSILVTSFIGSEEYDLPDNVERISIEKEQVIQSRLARNISRIHALREICKKEKPQIVISFMAEPNFRAVLATAGLRLKTIVSVRNDPAREYAGKLGRIVGKIILPKASGCVFQTQQAKQWFPKSLQKKSEVIYNDVAEHFFETDWIGGKDIVTIGRLCEQKNQKLLIEAFSSIADRYPNNRLLIYGIGKLEEELQTLIKKLSLNDRVVLMGLTERPQDVLREAGIFVLSSDYEGMPNVLMEALAVGVPCIATNCPCGGVGQLIEDRVNGLLIPVGNKNKMEAALELILSDHVFAEKIGKEAKSRAIKYRPEIVFGEWKYYVEKVMERNEFKRRH